MLSKERRKTAIQELRARKGTALKITLALAAIVTLGGGLTWWVQGPGKPPSPISRQNITVVNRDSVELTVTATGVIRPVNQVKISPKLTGLVKKLYVEQGDVVRKGQVLAQMDDSNLKGQLQAAQGAYQVARANYEKALHGNRPQEVAESQAQFERAGRLVDSAKEAVNTARSDLKAAEASLLRDETNAKRLTLLAAQGAISDQDRLNAATQAEVSRAGLEKTKRELSRAESGLAQFKAELESASQRLSMYKEGFRMEDVRAAEHAAVQAEGNLKFIQSQVNDTRIVAPFAGIVTQKYAEEGSIVTPTTAAATLSATSSSILSLAGTLEMVAAVAETDMDHIRLGQKVTIIANAYPETQFHGAVTRIAPEAIVTLNVTSFEVHTSIDDDPQHRLMSGMNVQAQFAAGRKNNVLVVPTSCVVTKQGKTGVYVPDESGQPKFKAIIVGPSAGTKTVVAEGLEEGDKVFIGLTKEQLVEEGYASDKGWRGGGKGSQSGKNSAPIPRGFGR